MLVNGNQIYSDKIGLHKASPSFFFLFLSKSCSEIFFRRLDLFYNHNGVKSLLKSLRKSLDLKHEAHHRLMGTKNWAEAARASTLKPNQQLSCELAWSQSNLDSFNAQVVWKGICCYWIYNYSQRKKKI